MKVYAPIGYYNDPEDIIDLYPSSTFKGDEADIIVKYYLDGYGAFHTIDDPYIDSFISPKDASNDKCVVFTSDGQYIVRFSCGDYKLLFKGSDMHGFFIDIYKLTEDTDYDEYVKGLEEEDAEPDITEMGDEELEEYALGLVKKVKEAVIEIKRRETKKSK